MNLFHFRVGVGYGLPVQVHGRHTRHREELVWGFRPVVQERTAVDVVIAGIRIPAIRSVIPRVAREHVRARVRFLERLPGDDGCRKERKLPAGVLADQPLACSLLPPTLGQAVVHDQVAKAQPSSRTKSRHLIVYAPLKGDGRVTQWAERHCDGNVSQRVVHDLVPHQDLDRIGSRLVADLDQDDRLLWL